jgi:hypothetical protein
MRVTGEVAARGSAAVGTATGSAAVWAVAVWAVAVSGAAVSAAAVSVAAVSAAGSLAAGRTPRIGASRAAVGASWPLSEGLPIGSLSMMTWVSISPCGAVGTPQPHAA